MKGKNEWRQLSSPERAAFASLLVDEIDYIHVVSGGADGVLRHWHLRGARGTGSAWGDELPMELSLCGSLEAHKDEVTRLHVSSNAVVYSVSKDATVYAWDIRSGLHSQVACFNSPVLCLNLESGALALGTEAGNIAHLAWQDPARDALRREEMVKRAYPHLEQKKEEKKQRLSILFQGLREGKTAF